MSSAYLDILKEYWHYDSFRSIQAEIIESIGQGKDTLGLMPTGGGKSITFQVPALAQDGVCIVVTPLIALMKDQVAGLRKRGILAHAITSGMTRNEMLTAYDNCIFGASKFLYVSPERLQSELFLSKLDEMPVSMLVVDEAHCISQWGYDFRPSYLRIADIREQLPGVPVLALTATATPQVADDIMAQLHFAKPNLFKMSFARPNIAYVVRPCENKEAQMIEILKRVEGSAIVYVRSRKRTREYAEMIRAAGISADFFHAGLSAQEKDRRQEAWTVGETRTMVCTNAFGMGIDKPDVRVVIHIDAPESLEAYFQEAGRAGRDGQKSYAVFLWAQSDAARLRRNVTNSFPAKDFIVEIYNSVCNYKSIGLGMGGGYSLPFDAEKFAFEGHRNVAQTHSALAILGRSQLMHYEPYVDLSSRLMFTIDRDRLYGAEEAYPHLAPVIRATLRLYTGLFTQYAAIDESQIGRLAGGMSQQNVYEKLSELRGLGIVDYNPRQQTSFVTMLQDRIHEKDIVIPRQAYDDRLDDARKRAESVIEYCSRNDKCRSILLLEYFGDTSGKECGHCDVCVARKRHGNLSANEVSDIETEVRRRLSEGPMPYNELREMQGKSSIAVSTVIREMVANGAIEADLQDIYRLTQ